MPAIDPSMLTIGGDWSVGLEATPKAASAGGDGESFGSILADQVKSLGELQNDATKASQELALGQAEDPSAAVLAVERARLAMQFAVTVRQKLTDATNEILRTQV